MKVIIDDLELVDAMDYLSQDEIAEKKYNAIFKANGWRRNPELMTAEVEEYLMNLANSYNSREED